VRRLSDALIAGTICGHATSEAKTVPRRMGARLVFFTLIKKINPRLVDKRLKLSACRSRA